MKNILFKALVVCLFFSSCKSEHKSDKPIVSENLTEVTIPTDEIYDLPPWAINANIYEVNLRQFTKEGTVRAFEKHLKRLKDMNVDILWFMPIFPISETKRKGSLGSYYSISDYKGFNPEHGTIYEFKAMVEKAHHLKMKVILDFVPNHTGWDSKWIKDNPDWFTQDKDGNIIDPIDPGTGESWGWTDVADLNYNNKEMRQAMIDACLYWVNEIDVDGFRMDVAHNVPQDFWDECSNKLQSAKDIFMLAESETASHRNSKAFHADYGWDFHHLLNDVAKGDKNANDIVEKFKSNLKNYTSGFHIHFTSNHDENTWNGTVFERMGKAHKPLAVLTATIQGMPLVYGGQEEPIKKRLAFFDKDDIGFGKYEYQEFYTKLLALKHDNKALWNGKYGDEKPQFFVDQNHILSYLRENGDDKVLVMLNLSDQSISTTYPISFNGINIMNGKEVKLKKGTKLTLGAYAYYVFSSK